MHSWCGLSGSVGGISNALKKTHDQTPDKKYTVDNTALYSPGSVVHAAMIAAM